MQGAKNGGAKDGRVCTCLRSFTIGIKCGKWIGAAGAAMAERGSHAVGSWVTGLGAASVGCARRLLCCAAFAARSGCPGGAPEDGAHENVYGDPEHAVHGHL